MINTGQAAAVSRALRARGVRPLPSGTPAKFKGVRVEAVNTWLGLAVVTIDATLPSVRAHLHQTVTDALTDAGYTVEANRYDENILYVKAA